MIRTGRGTKSEPTLKNDELIVAYKKGSGGEILRTYNSVKQLTEIEKVFNGSFARKTVWRCLCGRVKSVTLLHLQSRVALRIKKISDVKDACSNQQY